MALTNGLTNTIEASGESGSLIVERPVDSARPLKVRIAGAGISGIIAAIKLQRIVRDLDIELYDKNEDLGGTWVENRYPGCACGRLPVLATMRFRPASLTQNDKRYPCPYLPAFMGVQRGMVAVLCLAG
jgi:cation diffusion facilitator CzcD-associated flavoprotein CzcO